MALGTCNLGLESLPGYENLQKKAKSILKKLYNDDTFNAIIQKYYDDNKVLPNSVWIQTHLKEFKDMADTLAASETAEGGKNLSEASEDVTEKKPAGKSRKIKRDTSRERWSNQAGGGYEIGSKATTDLGKKFDPLKAILPENAVVSKKVGKKYVKVEVGGYSIAAAMALLKGYDQHGLKTPKSTKDINGYGEKVVSTSFLYSTIRQSERIFNVYKELWGKWLYANPGVQEELEKAVGDGIITDSSAVGFLYKMNPAKALAEILYGKNDTPLESHKEFYDKQRKNAVRAVDDILKVVKRSDDHVEIIPHTTPSEYSEDEEKFVNRIKKSSTLGIAFKYKYRSRLSGEKKYFINPFEGEENELEKFIQWIIPDDYASLPKDLKKEELMRDEFRRKLNRGMFKNMTFITDDNSKEGIRFVDVLKYVVNNFETLKGRYNPISDMAQDYALAKHKVSISFPIDGKAVAVLSEDMGSDVMNHRFTEIIRKPDAEGKMTNDYDVIMHEDNNNPMSATQRERLLKSAIVSIPNGARYSINGSEYTLRREKAPQMVVNENDYDFTPDNVEKNPNKIYIYGDNFVSLANNEAPKSEKDIAGRLRALPNTIGIPTKRNRDYHDTSYLSDSDYDYGIFKEKVDEIVKKIEAIIDRNNELYDKAQIEEDLNKKQDYLDQIKIIVFPHYAIGAGTDMLDVKAPKLFEYLQGELAKLEEKGNRSFREELGLGVHEANVRKLEEAPVTVEQALDKDVLDSPFIRTHQEFGQNLNDAVETIAEEFISMVEDMRYEELDRLDDEFSQIKNVTLRDRRAYEVKRKLLSDRLKGAQMALGAQGNDYKGTIIRRLKERLLETANDEDYDPNVRDLYRKACDADILDVLIRYALPVIEERSSLRVLIKSNTMSLEESMNSLEKNSNEEDPEGKKSTGNDGWSFNIRENDPYQSLSAGVRRIISTLKMYDPKELNKERNSDEPIPYLYNAMGSVKYWSSSYIYTAVMSWMAKNLRNDPDNFMTVQTEGLTEEEKKHFPKGKPVFHALEKMKKKYIWANELIDRLTDDYRVSDDPTDDELASIGNVVSQFYSNFNQQFINYYILVDGKLIAENQPSGAQSLKEATINNYEGRITLNDSNGEALTMIYNLNGGVDRARLQNAIDKLGDIKKDYMPLFTGDDFNDLMTEIDSPDRSVPDVWSSIDAERKKACTELSNMLKTFGINMQPYDVFCIAVSSEKEISFSMLLNRLTVVAYSLRKLSDEDHMIQSGKGMDTNGNGSVEQAWEDLFHAFGEYVSEKEYQSSFREGSKTRYSYSAPSFMSSMIQNLTNPDLKARKAFIEEHFMPYAWFYDKQTGKFKNKWLQVLYDGPSDILQRGHDMLNIKDHGVDSEYANWTPDQVTRLMFKEFYAFGEANMNSAYYIIPVLSDSQVCKTIQGPKYTTEEAYSGLSDVVRQELGRIKLCKNRAKLIVAQEKVRRNRDLPKDMQEPLTEEEKKLLDEHKNIHEIANFDLTKGLEFNFIPELNNWQRYASTTGANGTTFNYVNLLASLLGMKVSDIGTLSDAFDRLDRMDTQLFNDRMRELMNGSLVTKEKCKDRIIKVLLKNIFTEKIQDWIFDHNKEIQGGFIDRIVEANDDLRKERESLPMDLTGEGLSKDDKLKQSLFQQHVFSEIENFYINHSYAMTQFIQLMTTDVAFYKDSDDFSKRWKEVYGAGMKMNTNSKYGKKTETYIILKDNKRRSFSYDVFKNALENAVKDGRISNIDKEVILNKFKKINGTDAQALRGLTSYRTVLDMVGKWTPEMEKSYRNLKEGKWDMGDFYTIYQTIKPFTFSSEDTDSGFGDMLKVPSQQKNSEAVLLAIYATIVGSDPNGDMYSARAQGINMAMEEINLVDENGNEVKNAAGENVKAIDLVQYESSTKVGSQGVIDINYSRIKLRQAIQDSGVTISTKKHLDAKIGETYYDIIKRLDEMYDNGEIDQNEYNEFVDFFEPTAQEVKDIIERAIKSVDTEGQPSWGGYYNRQVLHRTPYTDYCIQQPTPEHLIDNDDGVFGSQIRHIILSDLPDNFSIEINGVPYDRDTLRAHYNKLIIANLMDCFRNDIETLFDDSDGRQPIYKLRDRIMSIIQNNPKYGRDVEQALDIVKDPETGKPVFALPLNNINVSVKLQEIVTSIFKNSITKQTIRGGNAIIAADIGYADSLKVVGERYPDSDETKHRRKLLDTKLVNFNLSVRTTVSLEKANIVTLKDLVTRTKEGLLNNGTFSNKSISELEDSLSALNLSLGMNLKEYLSDKNAGKLIPGGKIEGIECYLPASARALYEPFMVDSKGNPYGTTDENKLKDVKRDKEGNIIYTLDPKKLKKAKLDKGIGYRIPTEGHYSMMPLIIKGFLPQQNGSSIVIAAEVTQLSGSDNDVDKEYLMLPGFYISEYNMGEARKDFDRSKGYLKGRIFYEKIDKDGLTAEEIKNIKKDRFSLWFEKNKENYRKEEPIIEKITYDTSKSEREQSKTARDNEIIDIMYGILTHKQMSDKWIHPGNFDTLKINERRMRILKTRSLFGAYGKAFKLNTPGAILQHVRNASLDDLDTFLKEYAPQHSPIYPDTFSYYHAQNMAGVAEKGIFANNTTSQVKLQWANVNLTYKHTFNVEGRQIKRIDGRYIETKKRVNGRYEKDENGLQRISANCAECSAASVDNAKDPVLAGLNSNVKTAALYGYLLRMGLTIEEASLLFAQPHVDWIIKTRGDLKAKYFFNDRGTGVGNIIGGLLKEAGVDIESDPDLDWQKHDFTTDEWYENIICRLNIYKKEGKTTFDFTEDGDLKSTKNVERLKSFYRTYKMLADVINANTDYRKVQRVLTYDSPTHAISTSMAGAVLQTKDVERLNERSKTPVGESFFTGVSDLMIYKIEGKEDEEKPRVLNDLSDLKVIKNEDALFEKLANSELPITQAFYTLGIEKARDVFKSSFIFGRKEIQDFTDRLVDLMDKRYIFDQEQRERILDTAYRDFIVFMLTKTSIFDGDGKSTYDEKRQYYLYSFPQKFLDFKKTHPWVNSNEALSRMTVSKNSAGNPMLVLKRQGQQTTTMRDILMDSFQTLLSNKDPDAHELAKDLFMYTYYLNGFEFSYMSYGNLMGTQFLRAFPEYIQALRDMQTDPITDTDIDRFFEQFLLKRNNMRLLENIDYGDDYSSRTPLSHRSETLQHGYFDSGRELDYYGDEIDDIPQFITVDGGDVYMYSQELSDKHNTLCFTPLKQSKDALHYNAGQSIAEMMEVVYDTRQASKMSIGGQVKSNSSALKEYLESNVKEKLVDMMNQNDYSIDDNGKDNSNLAAVEGLESAEGIVIPDVEPSEETPQQMAQRLTNDLPDNFHEKVSDGEIDQHLKDGAQQIDDEFCVDISE